MEEHALITHIGCGGHWELAQAEHQQQHALQHEQGGGGGHRQQAAEPAQQGHGQQQGHADRLGPAETEELLESHAGEGREEGAHRQNPEGLLLQGCPHGSRSHPLGEQQPPEAARQPEELQGPVQGPQVDVDPAQGQAEAGGHQQQPGPEQFAAPLAPGEQQPQLAQGQGGQGQAIAQHLAAVVIGDRVGPEHAVEDGICRAGEAAAGHGVGASAPMLAERGCSRRESAGTRRLLGSWWLGASLGRGAAGPSLWGAARFCPTGGDSGALTPMLPQPLRGAATPRAPPPGWPDRVRPE